MAVRGKKTIMRAHKSALWVITQWKNISYSFIRFAFCQLLSRHNAPFSTKIQYQNSKKIDPKTPLWVLIKVHYEWSHNEKYLLWAITIFVVSAHKIPHFSNFSPDTMPLFSTKIQYPEFKNWPKKTLMSTHKSPLWAITQPKIFLMSDHNICCERS